jgi:pyruvate formate lyase activating enzyme
MCCLATLLQARQIGLGEGLKYVYIKNVPDNDSQNTHCPGCGQVLMRRHGFGIVVNQIRNGRCPNCSCSIAGVWKGDHKGIPARPGIEYGGER